MPFLSGLTMRRLAAVLALGAVTLGVAGCGLNKPPKLTDEERARYQLDAPKRNFCPDVDIRRETNGLPIYEKGYDYDPLHLRYQGTIAKTARECHFEGDQLIMRVGVAGRVLRGPAEAGDINTTLPIRIVVTDPHGTVVYSQLLHATEIVPAGAPSVPFSVVQENVIIPLGPEDTGRGFNVQTGFDASAR
ncbi:MAG: hypothetical protein KDJ77_15115 [Rhodobiaceae bacterium]|nr:hypothetical protein [Rhodobiaceae bacterium]